MDSADVSFELVYVCLRFYDNNDPRHNCANVANV